MSNETVFSSFEKAYVSLLKETIENGAKITSAENRWATRELIANKFIVTNPCERVLSNSARKVNIYQYIGQFLWILEGNYHIPDISYYVDAASRFTSDNIRNTGAYGFRLFGPGYLNQINDAITLLVKNRTSRRAVASVYMPAFDTDKTNHTGPEIPCTLNLQFLIRDNKLDLIAFMRSQDVQKVLPYDFFMFTMLQDYVAAILQVEIGSYHHLSGSFHVYETDVSWAEECLKDQTSNAGPMPRIPVEEAQYHFNTELSMFENELRKEVTRNLINSRNTFNSTHYIDELQKMPEYYAQWALVLLMRACVKIKNVDSLVDVTKLMKGPFALFGQRELDKLSILIEKDAMK